MSQGSVESHGVDVLRELIDRFPQEVQDRLKEVARASALRVQARARQILLSKTKGTGKTAASIVVVDESDQKQYVVHVGGNPDRPANLPLWIERGTRYISPRPFMRPAADEDEAQWRAEVLRAMSDAALRLNINA